MTEKEIAKTIVKLYESGKEVDEISDELDLEIDRVQKAISLHLFMKNRDKSTTRNKLNNSSKVVKKDTLNKKVDKKNSVKEQEKLKNKQKLLAQSELEKNTDIIINRREFLNSIRNDIINKKDVSYEDMIIVRNIIFSSEELFDNYYVRIILNCFKKNKKEEEIKSFISKYKQIDFSKKDINHLNNVINNLQLDELIIKKSNPNYRTRNNIYDYFSEYTKEEVDTAISKLSEHQKKSLNKFYDENLNKKDKKDLLNELGNLFISIKTNLQRPQSSNRKTRNNLYEYFSEYTKEEVDTAISKLSDDMKELLNNFFDKNLNRNEKIDSSKKISALFRIIKKHLENSLTSIPRTYKSRNNIYKYFSEYTKEEIDVAISKLSDNKKEILNSFYDKNLNRNEKIDTSERLAGLFKVIKEHLENSSSMPSSSYKNRNNLYEYFSEYTKEEVDTAISKLTEQYKEILNEFYDENLNKNNEKDIFYKITRLIASLKRKLNDNPSEKKKSRNNIYNYFSEYTKEEVDTAISKITEHQKEILKELYDNNLNRTETIDTTNRISGLLKAIKCHLNNPNQIISKSSKSRNNLYEYFSEYTKEEVDTAISKLSDNMKELLNNFYDKNLNRNEKIDSSKKISALFRIIKKHLENSSSTPSNSYKSRNNIYKYFSEYTKEEIDVAISKISDNKKEILNSFYDKNLNKNEKIDTSNRIEGLFKVIKEHLENSSATPSNSYKSRKNLYNYFSEYTKEEVDEAISQLPSKYQEQLYLFYDKDLNRNDIDDKDKLINYPIKMIKMYLKNKESKNKEESQIVVYNEKQSDNYAIRTNFLDYFTEFDISLIILKKLLIVDSNRYAFISRFYDDNLNKKNNITSAEDYKKINEIIDHIISVATSCNIVAPKKVIKPALIDKKILEKEPKENNDNNLSKKELLKLYEMFNNEKFIKMAKEKSIKEMMVIILSLVGIDGKYYSSKTISEYLDMNIDEVIKISNEAVKEYKDILLSEIDQKIMKLKKGLHYEL